jgi:hypothetical protein
VGSADTRVRLRPIGGKRTPHPLEGCAFAPVWWKTHTPPARRMRVYAVLWCETYGDISVKKLG